MNLKSKRILSGIMIGGDIFMALIAFMLIFEEDLFIIGALMLAFLAIDIYLTIDYIRSLKHREKVENSLRSDNENARFINRNWQELNRQEQEKERARATIRERARQRKAQRARQEQQNQPAPQQETVMDFAQAVNAVAEAKKEQTAVPQEEDLSDILTGPASPGSHEMHG